MNETQPNTPDPDQPKTPTPSPGLSQIRRSRLGGPLIPDAPAEASHSNPSPDQDPPPDRDPPRDRGPRPGPSRPRKGPPQNRPPRQGSSQSRRNRSQQSAPRPPFAPRRLPIIYEDEQIVAIDKPPRLPVIGTDEEPSVINLLRIQLRIHRRDRGPWTLHQIEESASGVVVLARTPAVRDEMLKSRRFERYYLALVEGKPAEPDAPDHGTINSQQPGRDAGEVRNLITHYQTLGRKNGSALLKLRPKTDARGQVDRHLKQLGAQPARDKPQHASGLHLHEVTLTHPKTGKRLRISAPAPAWMFERVGLEVPQGARTFKSDTPKSQGWDEVANWYAELLTSKRNDLQTELVWPRTMSLLEPVDGKSILDIACGEGSFARKLAAEGARVTGIDASEKLIDLANKLSDPDATESRFMVADARSFDLRDHGPFDAAVSILALMNIDDLNAVMRAVANALRPGGTLVAIILHPAFRSPRRTGWGWEGRDTQTQRQFRRVDAYLSTEPVEITMNPGAVAQGEPAITTTTYARPLEAYVQAAASAGLMIDTLQEWASPRQSEPGPRAAEENRARKEIPMFMAIRAVKPETK